MSEPTACRFEEVVHYANRDEIDRFCASPCSEVDGISVKGIAGPVDLALAAGVTEIGALDIVDVSNLETLHGLEEVRRIPWGLSLMRLSNLRHLNALRSLETAGVERVPEMSLIDLDRLVDLEGLEALQAVGVLVLEHNDNLESIEALENLESAHGLVVQYNPKLPNCQAEQLAVRLDLPPERVVISNNGTGVCE